MVREAQLEQTPAGLVPKGEGWFVVNAKEARWMEHEAFGSGTTFEGEPHFKEIGVNIGVLAPGQPACMYHRENQQEDFLVLFGECRVLVEGEERLLRQWDFFHSPAGTEHIFIGAGDGPCVILMAGARLEEEQLHYPVSELAARYGASVEEETTDFEQVFVRFERSRRERPSYWDKLPWASQ